MSKLQELARLESLRTTSLVVMGISIAACILGCIAAVINGLALAGCRFMESYSSQNCETGPTDIAATFALFTAVVALIAGITAIVLTSQISALRKIKN